MLTTEGPVAGAGQAEPEVLVALDDFGPRPPESLDQDAVAGIALTGGVGSEV